MGAGRIGKRRINEFDGTVLLVSHDRYFLNRVVNHLLVVEPGRFRVVDGNYNAYLHLVERGLAGTASEEEPTARQKSTPKASQPRGKACPSRSASSRIARLATWRPKSSGARSGWLNCTRTWPRRKCCATENVYGNFSPRSKTSVPRLPCFILIGKRRPRWIEAAAYDRDPASIRLGGNLL